ncbi:STAS domain-containing protein [Streptomyces sp. NPDC101733]|uniref:STAS domain-containing protein n=1 Tax=unclassified Streptomyces TaxID=2593676 RepID=UPI0038015253
MGIQHCGSSVLIRIDGSLDQDAEETLQEALTRVTTDERDVLVDLHGVTAMDTDGLFHLLSLHRRAEGRRLRVQVTGWQPQPQQLMAEVAGIPGARAATGERYAVAGFRRLLEDRTQRARDEADFTAAWLPRDYYTGSRSGDRHSRSAVGDGLDRGIPGLGGVEGLYEPGVPQTRAA